MWGLQDQCTLHTSSHSGFVSATKDPWKEDLNSCHQDTLLDQVPGYKVWNVEALRIWGPHDSAVAFQLGNGLKFVVGSDQNPIILVYFRFQHTSLGLCGSWTWRSTCQSTWTEIMLWIKGPSLWFVASGGCGRPFLLSSSLRGSKQIIQQPIP